MFAHCFLGVRRCLGCRAHILPEPVDSASFTGRADGVSVDEASCLRRSWKIENWSLNTGLLDEEARARDHCPRGKGVGARA